MAFNMQEKICDKRQKTSRGFQNITRAAYSKLGYIVDFNKLKSSAHKIFIPCKKYFMHPCRIYKVNNLGQGCFASLFKEG